MKCITCGASTTGSNYCILHKKRPRRSIPGITKRLAQIKADQRISVFSAKLKKANIRREKLNVISIKSKDKDAQENPLGLRVVNHSRSGFDTTMERKLQKLAKTRAFKGFRALKKKRG